MVYVQCSCTKGLWFVIADEKQGNVISSIVCRDCGTGFSLKNGCLQLIPQAEPVKPTTNNKKKLPH